MRHWIVACPTLAGLGLLPGLGWSLVTAPAAAASVDQVVVVFKTHFDLGYTDMASNLIQRDRTTMIDEALEVVEKNRELPPDQQFVWTVPGWPMLFWWEGPDGSRLLTMYSAEGYGTGLAPPADWPFRTWLALVHTGDNHGPPRPEEIRQLLDQARASLPGVKLRIGRLSDFADAILAEKPDLPVVRGDMPDTWIHGPLSDPQGARLARNTRPQIATTEILNTHLQAWGLSVSSVATAVERAYERSLLYGEHTWGGALY